MKKLFTLLTLSCSLGVATAQELLSPEELQKFVPRFVERAADQENPPFKAAVDAAKSVGMKVKEYGAVILPAKDLSREALAKADKQIVPVGHLWMKKLAPAVSPEKLRVVSVHLDNADHSLVLFYLGMRTTDAGNAELVIFGKDKDPIATLPLTKIERSQDAPVGLHMQAGTASLGEIEINILGQYRARLAVDEFAP